MRGRDASWWRVALCLLSLVLSLGAAPTAVFAAACADDCPCDDAPEHAESTSTSQTPRPALRAPAVPPGELCIDGCPGCRCPGPNLVGLTVATSALDRIGSPRVQRRGEASQTRGHASIQDVFRPPRSSE